MHHVYTNDLVNQNQFGFTPKKSTTDAAMAVKEFAVEGLKQGLSQYLSVWTSKVLSTPPGGREY